MGISAEQSVATSWPVLGEVIAPEVVVLLAVFIILLGGFVWIVWTIFRR
jgi:hypothetical protein